MRRILSGIAIITALLVATSILWIFGGERLSLFLDRFGTVEVASAPVTSISYEGTGNGGSLLVKNIHLSLSPADPKSAEPHFGTTKDEQLALSLGGKVFAFGPLRSETETLAAEPPAGDDASITTRRSVLSWPTTFDFNFMTGQSPLWKRHLYYRLTWKKSSGAKLDMLWRFEQYFYSGKGWASGFMTHEGSTGLIRIDISDAGR
jgi:hypothetical protein